MLEMNATTNGRAGINKKATTYALCDFAVLGVDSLKTLDVPFAAVPFGFGIAPGTKSSDRMASVDFAALYKPHHRSVPFLEAIPA